MANIRVVFLVTLTVIGTWVVARQVPQKVLASNSQQTATKNADLEKELWEVDQQWLCSTGTGPYHKGFKECIDFRNQFWAEKFFEISIQGRVQTKPQMVAEQTAAGFPAVQPYPSDFKLMADYGNFALATDHTLLKTVDSSGKVVSTTDTRVLRMFVKENGNWRPAGAALVPIISKHN
jgi:hypothetical protein